MKEQKGITLVALMITIIVMLILVGVTVSVVIESDLLETANKAGQDLEQAYEDEKTMGEDDVTITVNGEDKTISDFR